MYTLLQHKIADKSLPLANLAIQNCAFRTAHSYHGHRRAWDKNRPKHPCAMLKHKRKDGLACKTTSPMPEIAGLTGLQPPQQILTARLPHGHSKSTLHILERVQMRDQHSLDTTST